MAERERYSLNKAMSKLERLMDQIKDVMRYSDVSGVTINKWQSRDRDGKYTSHFTTHIHSDLDEEYSIEEEED